MITAFVPCATCSGAGMIWPPPAGIAWIRCASCDGLGRVWAPGGPSFGFPTRLRDRIPGEIVELATGERGRILWHHPKKRPETTFLGLFDAFDDHESHDPTPFPAVLGVIGGDAAGIPPIATGREDHVGEKNADLVDPVARRAREQVGPLL